MEFALVEPEQRIYSASEISSMYLGAGLTKAPIQSMCDFVEAHSGTAIKLLTDLDGDSPVPLWAAYMHYKGIIKLAGDDPVAVVLAMNGVPMDMAGIRLQDRRRRKFEANRECPRR